MACPHVAGAAAQLRGLHPELSARAARDLLLCFATDGAIAQDDGWGGSPNQLLYAGQGVESYHLAIALNGTLRAHAATGGYIYMYTVLSPAVLSLNSNPRPWSWP